MVSSVSLKSGTLVSDAVTSPPAPPSECLSLFREEYNDKEREARSHCPRTSVSTGSTRNGCQRMSYTQNFKELLVGAHEAEALGNCEG